MSISPAIDLERIAFQEKTLQFDKFDSSVAWIIGSKLKQAVEDCGGTVAIDIQMHGMPLFFYAMPGTTPDNVDWLRRKRNTVNRFHQSSYAIGRKMEIQQSNLTDKVGVPLADYATHGGCFPVRIKGSDCVIGTIAISGLPQRDDHSIVVQVIAEYLGNNQLLCCGIPVAEVALGSS